MVLYVRHSSRLVAAWWSGARLFRREPHNRRDVDFQSLTNGKQRREAGNVNPFFDEGDRTLINSRLLGKCQF